MGDRRISINLPAWLPLAACALCAAALLWLAPSERMLGMGIKVVYVHVAFIWTGLTGICLVGLLGLYGLLFGRDRLWRWTEGTAWVALAYFTIGIALSLLAARINWGAVDWHEPRTISSSFAVVLAILFLMMNRVILSARWRGLVCVVLSVTVVLLVELAPLVMHPRDPIGTSTSASIRGSFYGLFLICAASAFWLVRRWALRARS
jgi:hypothetical protein